MSRFFDSIEEEKSEQKKNYNREEVFEEEEKQTKKEKKIHDLRIKIMDLEEEENIKKFDKNMKKIFTDIKKAENAFEKKLPGFLKRFLTSEKAYTKTNKSKIDELLLKYGELEKKEDEVVEVVKEKKIEKSLESIFVIKDQEKRLEELNEYINETEDIDLKIKALIPMLSIYIKTGDMYLAIDTMKKIACYADKNNPTVKSFVGNISLYLTSIFENLNEDLYEDYKNLMEKLVQFDEKNVERRIFEFRFFILNENFDNDDVIFRTLFLIRSNNYKEAKEHYLKNLFSMSDEDINLKVVQELGIVAFKEQDYMFSFEVLKRMFKNDFETAPLELKLLCVILNDKIKTEPIFILFLDKFNDFSENSLCLPSINNDMEIYRAFYLLNLFDVKEAANVIRNFNSNFNENPWFTDLVMLRTCHL